MIKLTKENSDEVAHPCSLLVSFVVHIIYTYKYHYLHKQYIPGLCSLDFERPRKIVDFREINISNVIGTIVVSWNLVNSLMLMALELIPPTNLTPSPVHLEGRAVSGMLHLGYCR